MKAFFLMLFIPFSMFSSELLKVYDDIDYYYYYIDENDNYQRRLYESCENLAEYEHRVFPVDQLFNCRLGNISSSENEGVTNEYFNIDFKFKKYRLGVNISNYSIKRSMTDYGDYDDYKGEYYNKSYVLKFIYYEYFISNFFYLGGRVGLIDIYNNAYTQNNDYDSLISPYLGFNPLYAFKYLTFGINFGLLISSQLKDNFLLILDMYLGFKLSNVVFVNIEFGLNNHLGLSLGILF